jgi:hypothetical protein
MIEMSTQREQLPWRIPVEIASAKNSSKRARSRVATNRCLYG